MKKLAVALILLVLTLAGCTSDSDYIETVKKITFDDGSSVEEIVKEKVKVGEFYSENDLDGILSNPMQLFLFSMNNAATIRQGLKDAGIKMPVPAELKWEIDGDTKDGKILIASNDKIKVRITTRKNGDYVELYGKDIQAYIKKNNKMITDEMYESIYTLYNLAIENGYTGIEEKAEETPEITRFNEKKVLANEEGIYTVEYYPSGRVKYLTDSYMEVSPADKNNLKEIEKNLKELEKSIGTPEYDDEAVNYLVDFSIQIEYEIIAEKLNKKIKNGEKKDIAELEKKAGVVFDKLQKEVERIIKEAK